MSELLMDGIKLIVYDRLKEIVPDKNLFEMSIIDVEHDVGIAFKIIGYLPKNFEKAFQKTWETSDAKCLFQFVFDVWRSDNEL